MISIDHRVCLSKVPFVSLTTSTDREKDRYSTVGHLLVQIVLSMIKFYLSIAPCVSVTTSTDREKYRYSTVGHTYMIVQIVLTSLMLP